MEEEKNGKKIKYRRKQRNRRKKKARGGRKYRKEKRKGKKEGKEKRAEKRNGEHNFPRKINTGIKVYNSLTQDRTSKYYHCAVEPLNQTF